MDETDYTDYFKFIFTLISQIFNPGQSKNIIK